MSVLKKPIITEKMSAAGDARNQYGFIVDPVANKIEIRKAVQDMYQVTVEKVNTLKQSTKARNRNTKTGLIKGRKGGAKKAIVTLKKGETIDFYSSI